MKRSVLFAVFSLTVFLTGSALAEEFGGIEFPNGVSSFADMVVSYEPGFGGGPEPSSCCTDPGTALGAPDYDGGDGEYVSLGRGGRITLAFTDNALTGSDDDTPDLHIFEIGPDVEDTFVAISKDGINFIDIGKVFGSTSSIDIDAFGFDSSDRFFYVRLTDDPDEGGGSGATVGADIDAVGAITTVGVVCADVITYAQSPATGNWVAFPTPCDVPENWTGTPERPDGFQGLFFGEGFQAGAASCETNGPCDTTVTISEDLNIHIPRAVYSTLFTTSNVWIELENIPNDEGIYLWRLSDGAVIED